MDARRAIAGMACCRHGRSWATVVLAASVLLVAVGCRTVTITSEPSGAMVRVAEEEIGATPLTHRIWQGLFPFHGEYRITASKPGYRTAIRRFQEGPSDNVYTAIPAEIHFHLTPLPEDED